MLAHEVATRPSAPPGPRVCPRCQAVYPWAVWTCQRDGARLVERADELVGTLVGQYALTEEIGRGGCGRIYRAMPTFMAKPVALKVLMPGADATLVERFRREAGAMRRVRHPNVAAILDSGTTRDGRDFLVMELIQGHALSAELEGRRVVDTVRAARIVREVALALQAVHDAGLVHRDIKPDNVMITEDGRVKLIDFGVARDLCTEPADQLTAAGRVSGTPRYMPPEVFEGRAPDPRSDLYGLGIMLYELLTGFVPFEGSIAEIAVGHIQQLPAPLPGELGALAMALLAKDPELRPQSALEVVARVDAIIARATAPRPLARASSFAPAKAATAAPVRALPVPAAERPRLRRVYEPLSAATRPAPPPPPAPSNAAFAA